ncbi:MAG: hypothetical protein GTO02_19735 [Candidatus Dadabacteria bacterium]|nr:hypothetical protein [Candidatus Dadabacteria bacterium]NIQ16538.1 hypothetical protein [Candidatus Dadabacteria bacterium]
MNKLLYIILIIIFSGNLYANESGFRKAIEPYDWSFPKDHGSHPDFLTEWWYFTGHLESDNQVFGFELTTFRFSNKLTHKFKSKWASDQIYLTHFTITDEKNNKFYKYELVNRNFFDFAGSSENGLNTWNGNYKMMLNGDKFKIIAKNEESELILDLTQESKIMLNGKSGLSQKGAKPGDASYYYSIPILKGSGKLKIQNDVFNIKHASVWMDREFFSIEESENSGWDWFSIQFDDGSVLMLYQIRDKEGKQTQFSSGTFLNTDGKQILLEHKDFELKRLDYWKSPKTNKKYPLKWRIIIPELNINITITPTMKNQELVLKELLDMTYWEGRCLVSGSHSGKAYMELVGY